MTFKIEILRTATNVNEHIDMMDFLNQNTDPLLKKLGEPYTHFLWQMMADKHLIAHLNKFESATGKIVYMIGMSIDGLDYFISTEDDRPALNDPLMKHKAHLWDMLSKQTKANKLMVVFTDEQRRALGECPDNTQLERYVHTVMIEQSLKDSK